MLVFHTAGKKAFLDKWIRKDYISIKQIKPLGAFMRNVITSTMGACHELCVVAATFMLVLLLSACGDDSSSVAPNNDEPSSSANSSSSAESSSSEKDKSSSSSAGKEKSSVTIISGADLKFSSSMESSSSEKDLSSSSEVPNDESSSSVNQGSDPESSSSSAGEMNCSALLEGVKGWNWDVSKECWFNLDITYDTMIDSRDGQTYKTVKIGDQTWMAENLNYSDSATTPSLKGKSWCYNDEPKNCAVAGRLYTWPAAIDSVALYDGGNGVDCGYKKTCTLPAQVQGICPNGWHLPTSDEWAILFDAVGGQSNAGKKLKAQTGWYSGGNGTNAFGFSAPPAGDRGNGGDFGYGGINTGFLSATEGDRFCAYGISLYYNDGSAHLDCGYKYYASSVRCLKD